MENIETQSILGEYIKKCSYIKDVYVNYDLPLKRMGIGEVEFISLIILIEKKYEFDFLKHLELNSLLSYTPNVLLGIINSYVSEGKSI